MPKYFQSRGKPSPEGLATLKEFMDWATRLIVANDCRQVRVQTEDFAVTWVKPAKKSPVKKTAKKASKKVKTDG